MKRGKRKKGSTFIIVVIVMAVIFTTGTTILAVTANDYKMRINESKKLQNLYEADSGLDIVENIIIKTSQEAIKYADKEVKKQLTNTKEESRNNKNLNKLFKEKFYEFFSQTKSVKNFDGTITTNARILDYLILSQQVINSIEDNKTLVLKRIGENKDFIIEIPNDNGYVVNDDGSIKIKVNSTFETKEGTLRNKKTVSTDFTITAPEYNSKITAINIYPVFDGKALTADGNMTVSDGSLDIKGDIWVKGIDSKLDKDNKLYKDNPAFTFDKYNGGISLENTKFNIYGNIYTANTFHLKNNVEKESSVNGNIYAKNVYVGKSIESPVSDSNNISFEKDVIVNNDLALNAKNSNILIKNNFYGINDKTVEADTAKKALNSSSIIVNDLSNTSKITVNNDSYIMGVAYLNATDSEGNKYQTGESVAVKGNYLAYTDVEDILNGKDNVTLKYYSPLQLLESKNEQSNPSMKADYFAEYYSKDTNYYKFNDGGVNLKGAVKSVGTSVKDNSGNIQKSNITSEDLNLVNEQRNEFARNVFAMGDATGFDNLYGGQEVKRTVSNQIDFDKVKSIENNTFNQSEGSVILIGSNNESLVIENGALQGTSNKITKGLIITNGDITIKGKFDFTGNIITTGNIKFEGSEEKKITYDPQVVRNVIASNYDVLKDIFKTKESVSKGEEIKVNASSELYNAESFLKKSLWKIVK
ncbi:hypothetical protein SDC9_63452 [bioreactor metagenome]|uniref:Uncharacterized protein n=1 Tax=bioreactor metagenome TaxID=1076179 RepID=A0A644XMS5_9ZZZZ